MKNVVLFDSPIKILGGAIILIEATLATLLTTAELTSSERMLLLNGMIISLILTIIGAVVIQWFTRKRVSGAKSDLLKSPKEYDYDLFLSFAIAGVKSKSERNKINEFANELEKNLKRLALKEYSMLRVIFLLIMTINLQK